MTKSEGSPKFEVRTLNTGGLIDALRRFAPLRFDFRQHFTPHFHFPAMLFADPECVSIRTESVDGEIA